VSNQHAIGKSDVPRRGATSYSVLYPLLRHLAALTPNHITHVVGCEITCVTRNTHAPGPGGAVHMHKHVTTYTNAAADVRTGLPQPIPRPLSPEHTPEFARCPAAHHHHPPSPTHPASISRLSSRPLLRCLRLREWVTRVL
jgi:hypothetical protein